MNKGQNVDVPVIIHSRNETQKSKRDLILNKNVTQSQ